MILLLTMNRNLLNIFVNLLTAKSSFELMFDPNMEEEEEEEK
jgi:hypothetical protein